MRNVKVGAHDTITSTDVVIAANVENNMDLFKSTARRFRRGISGFRCALDASSSPIPCNACDLSKLQFIRAINTEVNDATAPNKNAGDPSDHLRQLRNSWCIQSH